MRRVVKISRIDKDRLQRSPIAPGTLLEQERKPTLGIVYMAVSCLLMSVSDVLVKLLTQDHSPGEIILFRGLLTVLLIVSVVKLRKQLHGMLRVVNPFNQIVRALLFALGTVSFVWALKHLPLAVATALTFLFPVFSAALAGPLLGERVGWSRWGAIALGFLGVLLITEPFGAHSWNSAMVLPMFTAFVIACRDIVTRKMTMRESTSSMLLYGMCMSCVVGLILSPPGWRMPTALNCLMLVAIAILFLGTHYTAIQALKHAEISTLGPLQYSTLIAAIAFGYIFWSDVPSLQMLAGFVVVACSGIYVFVREARLGKRRTLTLGNPPT